MTAARRVLFTIPNLDTAGSGAAMLAIASGLDRDRHEPTVLVRERRGTGLEAAVEGAGIDLIEAEVTVPGQPYHRLPGRVRRAALTVPEPFDLWHSFHYLDDYTEPLVARAAGCRRWVFTKKNMAWGSRAWRLRRRLASGVAVQNPAMVDAFFADFRRPLRVVPPGVDAEHFSPGPPGAPGWRERLGLGDGDVLVTNVAHLLANKGQLDLVRALAATPGHVHLVLAGRPLDDGHVAEVDRVAAETGVGERTHRVGAVDDVVDLLRASDLFAFASAREASPVAVLEAMSTGLAVVVTDIDGTRHLVDHQVEGLRVPVGSVDGLAASLRRLADDPDRRRSLGEAGRARVLAEFTVAGEVARYQDLYDEVLGR